MPKVPARKATRGYGSLRTVSPEPGVESSEVPSQAEKLANDIYDRQIERINKVAVLDASNSMASYDRELLNDPDSGALNQLGRKALSGFDDFVNKRQEYADGIMNGLSNDTQRDAFSASSAKTSNNFRKQLDVHQAKETLRYENEVYKTGYERVLLDTEDSYRDEDRLKELKHELNSIIVTNAQANDRGADWVSLAKRNAISDLHKKVVAQYTASGDHSGALDYSTRFSKEMVKDEELSEKIKTNADRAKGNQTAQDAWDEFVDPSSYEALKVADLEQHVRDNIDKSKDPVAFAAAMGDVKERSAVYEAARQQRITDRGDAMMGMYKENMTLSQVQSTEEYQSMGSTDQVKFDSAWADMKDHDADKETKKPTAAQLEAFSQVYEVDNLSRMSMEEIHALWPHLGAKLTQDLKNRKEILDKIDLTDPDVTAQLMRNMLADAELTLESKEARAEFEMNAIKALSRAQIAKGRKLDDEEMLTIIQKEVDNKVWFDHGWFSRAQEAPWFNLTPEQRGLTIVPKNMYTKIYNRRAAKGLSRDDGSIQREYQEFQNREQAFRLGESK